MRDPLIGLYDTTLARSSARNKDAQLLNLPLPHSDPSEIVLTLISNYLCHAMTCLFHCNSDPTSVISTLYGSTCVLQWGSHFVRLPSRQHDAVFTRTYGALTAYVSTSHLSPQEAYRLRSYALLCLVQTRPTVISPDSFWDQCVKFIASYVATAPSEKGQLQISLEVIGSCQELIQHVERREDRTEFLNGSGFTAFCEYWVSCSRQVCSVPIARLSDKYNAQDQ